MHRIITISIISFFLSNLIAQKSDKNKELEKWITENEIVFGSPKTPAGYERFLDCNDIIAFRKEIGDTIITYSRGRSMAEPLTWLKMSVKKSDWNTLRYPIYKQPNGTIVVQDMRKRIFLARNDTLYLYDDYNQTKAAERLKIKKSYSNQEISKTEYKALLNENKHNDYGFIPKFKIVYFKGIFNSSKTYNFNAKENFRQESVSLLRTMKLDGIQYYEINLETYTAGKFVINDDLSFINTELCE